MDSAVAMALFAKAQLVFAAEDTFLSFPLATPYVYNSGELAFMSGQMTDGRFRVLKEYSHIVDAVPSGAVWQPSDNRSLSAIYLDILETARLAASSRTAQEDADYQKAVALLYTTAPDGSRCDTPCFQTYKQYRDAYYSLQENYNNQKIDASYSNDSAAKDRWDNIDEPAMNRRMKEMEADWYSLGFRAQVEQAMQVKEALGARAPALLWAEWKKQCDPEIDMLTDPETEESFYPSGFAPSNLLDAGAWSKFTLSGNEVKALADHAPRELAGRLGSDPADQEIESLSLEFCSVRVERSWFVPGVFDARFWNFTDPKKKISDGVSGYGYVVALVFARNIQVLMKQRPQIGGRPPIPGVASLGIFRPIQPLPRQAGQLPAITLTRGTRPPAPALTRLQRSSFMRIAVTTKDHSEGGALPRDDDIHILGLICKRLPVCPNPDQTLEW